MNGNKFEETTQTIGKIRFVVVSQFQEKRTSVKDKIKNLLEREIHDKNIIAHSTEQVIQTIINK